MIKNKKCEKVNHSLITKYKVFTNKKHEWEREREIEKAVAVERERESSFWTDKDIYFTWVSFGIIECLHWYLSARMIFDNINVLLLSVLDNYWYCVLQKILISYTC